MECCLMSINAINTATAVNKINQPVKPLPSQEVTDSKTEQQKSLIQPQKTTDTYVPSSKLDNSFVTYGK